ncbi:MAG: efflux RND transporter periplasmic adaptor subunit [Deltaproteobacteria bacterium]|nr:efflux RND transporter periplasmic adaptor subunit [Deltaproteobacteria bacterium]
MIKRFIIVLLVLIVIFGGIFGYKAYKGYEMGQAMKARKYPPVSVSVAVSKIGNWQPYIHTIGNVSAINSVNVTTQVAGQVNGIYFRSGEFVRKNQVLVTLDDSLQIAQLKQYKSQFIADKFNYEQYKKAYAQDAVSKASYISMLSTLRQNEAQIAQAEVTIADMTIRAPFSGIVGIRNSSSVNLGQYIKPGANIIPLYSINPIYIDFTMPQNDLHSLKINQKVKIKLNSYHKIFYGRIKTISIDVNTVSRNITARVIADNNGMYLRPGMFVTGRVFLPVIHSVVTVPVTAVTYNPYGDFVYVVVKKNGVNIVKTDYVKTGEERNGVVVILKGLKAGEKVVTAGQVKLRNGLPVAIKNEGADNKSKSKIKSNSKR